VGFGGDFHHGFLAEAGAVLGANGINLFSGFFSGWMHEHQHLAGFVDYLPIVTTPLTGGIHDAESGGEEWGDDFINERLPFCGGYERTVWFGETEIHFAAGPSLAVGRLATGQDDAEGEREEQFFHVGCPTNLRLNSAVPLGFTCCGLRQTAVQFMQAMEI
jgi:hypothetical protein